MTTALTDQIRDYFADIEHHHGAVDVVANLERSHAPIRAVISSSTHWPAASTRWWVYPVSAAAMVVALVAGLIFGRSFGDDGRFDGVVPVADNDTTPVTFAGETETPMRLLEQAVTPSSIGDLRWTVLESASGTALGGVWRGPTGYASVQAGRLMVSDDAVSWRAVDLPSPGRALGLSAGRAEQFRLTIRTPGGSIQHWESPGLETWNLWFDESAAIADWVEGPGLLTARFGGRSGMYAVLPDGSVFASVSVGLDFGGQLVHRVADDEVSRVFDEHGSELWWVLSDPEALSGIAGVAVITTNSWQTWDEAKVRSLAAVEFEVSISGTPDDWVVEVTNPVTGESLGTVRGSRGATSLQNTLTALVSSQFEEWFVINAAAEPAQPDWAAPSGSDPLPVEFATTVNGLFAYLGAGPNDIRINAISGAPEIWRTTDGRSWEHLGSAAGWPEAGFRLAEILEAPDGGLVAVLENNTGQSSFLTSDDAINWQPARQSPALDAYAVFSTEHGFVLLAESFGLEGQVLFKMWTSPDGDVWELVDAEELIFENADLTHMLHMFGSTPNGVTVTSFSEEGTAITWIVEVG